MRKPEASKGSASTYYGVAGDWVEQGRDIQLIVDELLAGRT